MGRGLVWLAVLSVGSSGCCETEETAELCVEDTDVDVVFQTYHYVMILDRTTEQRPDQTGGADIAGVELVKSGQSFFASQIHWCDFGDFDNSDADDCEEVLDVPTDGVGECDPGAPDFLSMGGSGGQLVVSFGNLEEIREGNAIFVYECGTYQNPGAIDEPYDVHVGVSTTPSDPNWVPCATDASGVLDCTVPQLPLSPPN